MMNIHEYKDKIIGRSDNFMYLGDLDLDVWGTTLTVHRDSELIERSNWRVISNDMLTRFPKFVRIEHFSHWAVGWVNELKIYVGDEDTLNAAFEWYLKLENYPIADEDDYQDLEQEELEYSFNSGGRQEVEEWLTENDIDVDSLGSEKDYQLFRLWCDCYYYNGEMYADDRAMEDAVGNLPYI